jgi:hypothetical protein
MSSADISGMPSRRRITRRTVAWVIAGVFLAGMALLTWNQIARTLGAPIYVQFSGAYTSSSNLPAPTGGTATVTEYWTNGVSASLTHVSAQLQWLIAGSIVVTFVLLTAVLLVAGILWVRTAAGRPFTPLVIVSMFTLAGLVAVLGVGLEVLNSFIHSRESIETFGPADGGGYGLQIGGLSVFIGMGIALLASAFLVGARLSRETEGLV